MKRTKMLYRAVLIAEPGSLCLGGVPRHTYTPTYDGRAATRLAVIGADINAKAGRKVTPKVEKLAPGSKVWEDAAEYGQGDSL